MKRNQLTTHLFLDEYIPKELYLKYEKNSYLLIGLIDRNLVKADQLLRSRFGMVTINNWWNGGDRQWSGLRTIESDYFSPTSQHTFGRASDKLFKTVTSLEVLNYISVNYKTLGINCIESNVAWVHSDVRCYCDNLLLVV